VDGGADAGSDGGSDAGADAGSYVLTIVSADGGPVQGDVTSTPSGIDCGSMCTHAFAAGTQVALSDIYAAPGYYLCGFSGSSCSGNPFDTCIVTMDADQTVVALFLQVCTMSDGDDCAATNPCHVGRYQCSPCFMAYCQDTGTPRAAGYACGDGGMCDGNGNCL
jgi:hypothetical protein